jgi:hypothetical protein
MTQLIAKILLIIFASISIAYPWDQFLDVLTVVQADQPITLSVQADSQPNEGVHTYATYRLYLSSSLEDWGICYLLGTTDIKTHNVSVRIPASVGPSDVYSIITILSNTDLDKSNSDKKSDWIEASRDNFNFEGGTGVLSPYEDDPSLGMGAQNVGPNGLSVQHTTVPDNATRNTIRQTPTARTSVR